MITVTLQLIAILIRPKSISLVKSLTKDLKLSELQCSCIAFLFRRRKTKNLTKISKRAVNVALVSTEISLHP